MECIHCEYYHPIFHQINHLIIISNIVLTLQIGIKDTITYKKINILINRRIFVLIFKTYYIVKYNIIL